MDTDFEKYLEDSLSGLNLDFKPGQRVKGVVTAIDKRNVFIDVRSTSEGVINREELLDDDGELTVKVGDEVEAFFVESGEDGITLSVKMTGKHVIGHLEDAYDSGIPVEGKVTEERKGGYTVRIAGNDAFCPYSQMSLNRGEPADFIGNTYTFTISELNRSNFVVSRREILRRELEESLEQLKNDLSPGMILHGVVAKVMDFGAFVDIGGVQGLIPVSELQWSRTNDPRDLLKPGDHVDVSVLALDWANDKITLSYRAANAPWDAIAAKYAPGVRCQATITRLTHFGAFAEIEPGLEGLIHISKLGAGKRINHPKEVVQEGDVVEVEIDSIDEDNHRISLSRNVFDTASSATSDEVSARDETTESDAADQIVTEGARLNGVVTGIKPFGVFVQLNAKQTGLMHVSETDTPQGAVNTYKALNEEFPPGSNVKVIVKEISGDRISLSWAAKADRLREEAKSKGDHKDAGGGSFGSIGDLFDADAFKG